MGSLNRRQLLKLIPGTLIPGTLIPNAFASTKDFGYLPKQLGPLMPKASMPLGPRVALLYQYKRIIPHYQKNNPDCTAHAAAVAVEVLNSIEHYLLGKLLLGEVSTEWLYAKALEKIGKKRGGTAVDDTVDVLKEGFLWRKKYSNIDLSTYNFKNWKKLSTLVPTSKVIESTRVTSWIEANDAIKKLQPVIIGSAVGFDDAVRDSMGFIKPKGKWFHAWCLIGIDDRFHRPGGLLLSSHGPKWPGGPKRHNQPNGTAWVDAEVLDKMLSKYGDSFAISNIQESGTNDSGNKVVFYSSSSCGPCQKYKPIIAQFPEIVTIENDHNVSPIPQIHIIIDGTVVDILVGLRTKQELANFLK